MYAMVFKSFKKREEKEKRAIFMYCNKCKETKKGNFVIMYKKTKYSKISLTIKINKTFFFT